MVSFGRRAGIDGIYFGVVISGKMVYEFSTILGIIFVAIVE